MKKNIFKTIASALCTALLLTSFAGCGGSKNKSDNETNTEVTPPIATVQNEYLYQDGVSEYSVLIPNDANYYEDFAARELAENLERSTGNRIPIVTDKTLKNANRVISLGHTKLWDQKVNVTLSDREIMEGGYYVQTVEKNIYISTPDSASGGGVLYGVYDFLKDTIGYEFYAADEIQYQEKKEIPLIDYAGTTVNPTFEMRMLPNADLRDNSDTVRRYRMISPNSEFGLIAWGHGQASQYIHPDAQCTCGTSSCGNGITYRQHHPDWFTKGDVQLCWTGGELLEEVAANRFIDYFQQHPDAQYFMFGQEDNRAACECDRCQAAIAEYGGNAAGLQVAFVNKIIERTTAWLEENQPGRRVKYIIYAYYATEEAPVKKNEKGEIVPYSEKVVPADDLYVFYTPIGANFAFQIDSPQNADTYKNLSDWSVIADGQLIMYLYDINFRNYLINFNNFGTVKGMYELCNELGVTCISSQAADSYTACFQEMRAYVESSLMWNVNQSYDDLVRKFMKAYFKDAADYIYEFYQITRDRYAYYQNAVDISSGGIYGDVNSAELWSQSVVEKMDAVFKKAEASIEKYKESDPMLYEKLMIRIKKEYLSPLYLKITLYRSSYSSEEMAEMRDEFKYYATMFKLSESQEGSDFGDLLA
ncbi:MAG: DUF4838 domain-containing protein [Clostridia bacterium]|nr:DUF4838 domain-containing protein [Clostridia bacterium]